MRHAAGCDPQRFFSVFDRLLRLKDGNFDLGDDLSSMSDDLPEGSDAGKTGAASLPEAQRSVTLLRGQQLSQLIAMNGPVKAALKEPALFDGRIDDAATAGTAGDVEGAAPGALHDGAVTAATAGCAVVVGGAAAGPEQAEEHEKYEAQ